MRRLALALCLLLGACGLFDFLTGDSQRERLQRNRDRWESLQIRDYDFDFDRSCFCPPEILDPVRIEVRAGEISRIVNLQTGETVQPQFFGWPTIDSLFAWTDRNFDVDYKLSITYDPTHHFPTRVQGDIPDAIDDEFVRTATNFVRK
jgi:hypothetical protein